ncbi:MAG: FAD-dependent oxidoreductase [Anaerolineales bacterium]|nr:FAD-dependent oxidoreductase [Anaerolineales bacterium]
MTEAQHVVAVIGAGPAGLYAAKHLADHGVRVVLFNRDIKPGGLAEYGIYYNKYKMKLGLRKQFNRILSTDQITYYGNVMIGRQGDLQLADLWKLGFQAILVAVGAQGTKWLGLPGESLQGVYHAKDLVYHYNQLPPYSQQEFAIGRRVTLIGVGNVMLDIAHWLTHDLKVDEVVAVARRGPAEVKFTKKELGYVAQNLDLAALDTEFERVSDRMRAVGQDPQPAKDFILSGLENAQKANSETRFRFDFFASPKRILDDGQGRVAGLEVEDTELVTRDGDTKAVRLGTTRILDVDTVVFCIGDKVDEAFGLPVEWNEYVKSATPRFPVNDFSYEVFDPQGGKPIDGIFVAGWSREASSGLVGLARKDGESGAAAALQFLQAVAPAASVDAILQGVEARLAGLPKPVIDKEALQVLEAAEQAQAVRLGLEAFKFNSNEEMLAAIRSSW